MKFSKILPLLTFAVLLFAGLVACNKTTLSPTGVYHGDTTLYAAEKTIVTAHGQFQSFLKWELQYRDILPVEVSRAADVIRINEKKWIDSANALHDAYVATPTAENKDKMQLALNLIDSGLSEAAKYMATHKSKAPNTEISK